MGSSPYAVLLAASETGRHGVADAEEEASFSGKESNSGYVPSLLFIIHALHFTYAKDISPDYSARFRGFRRGCEP